MQDDIRQTKSFRNAFIKAQEAISSSKQMAELIAKASVKINVQGSRIKRMRGDLESLFRFILAWTKGDYKKVPIQTIILAVAAVVYFLNPFDAIHDYLPGAGYIDDASVLAFVMKSLQNDLKEFLIWEKHS